MILVLASVVTGCAATMPTRAYRNSMGEPICWAREDFPLIVHISDNLSEIQQHAAIEAMNHWNEELGFTAFELSYRAFSASGSQRSVYVLVTDIPDINPPNITQGLADTHWHGNHYQYDYVFLDVEVADVDAYLIFLHEFGHVLGLTHSPLKQSIMYWCAVGSGGDIMPEDIAFIRSEAGLE